MGTVISMGEKGSLKNRVKEWLHRRKYNQKKKEEQLALDEKKKQLGQQKKKKELEDKPSFQNRIQTSLKFVFGMLLGVVEQISDSIQSKSSTKEEGITDRYRIKEMKEEKYIQPTLDSSIVQSNITKEKEACEYPEDNKVKENVVEENNAEEAVLLGIEEITKHVTVVKEKLEEIKTEEKEPEEKRQDLISLKAEVQDLKKQYVTFASENDLSKNANLNELENIDVYDLKHSPKQITALITACDKELSELKKQRRIYNDKNLLPTKKEKTESLEITKKDINRLKTTIEENLVEQQIDIEEIKNLFNEAEISKKRGTIVTGIHNFLSKTINIGFSLLPLSICKNKFVGMLGSTIVLNNRLRSMRKMIRKENQNIDYITYKKLLFSVQNEKMCIMKMQEVLNDSVLQLNSLKQEFIMEFYYDMDRYPEVENIMTEFSNIEYQLTSKEMELDKYSNTISKVEEKTKQKVKVIE